MIAARRAATLFRHRFGRGPCWLASAPGRVNLIGEHTDYNGGWVLPIAINRRTAIAAAPAAGPRSCILAADLDDRAEASLSDPLQPVGSPRWLNYLLGVIRGFQDRGCAVPELDLLVASDLPIGGGLSSSAALEVALAVLLESVLAERLPSGGLEPLERIRLCQAAEHAFPGTPCGIMDMFIASEARADEALLIDCGRETAERVPLRLRGDEAIPGSQDRANGAIEAGGPQASLIVMDTGVTHDLADGAYRARRETCARAARTLGLESLRDADLEGVARLPEPERRRTEHVLAENARTRAAAAALRAGDMPAFGAAMLESHASLRDLYEVSCLELDTIVAAAAACPGVLGARMTGGGFGGSAIILAEPDAVARAAAHVAQAFTARHGRKPAWFSTPACAGARIESIAEKR